MHAMLTVSVYLGLVLLGSLVSSSQGRYSHPKYHPRALNKHDTQLYGDCHEVRKVGGYNVSGVYTLHMNKTTPFQVYCEHTADNSFTVIQRRMSPAVTFIRSWPEYVSGFGNVQDSYWAGLNHIFYLTSTGNNVLTINMQTWNGEAQNVRYSYFRLQDSTYFTLNIGGFFGSIPDDLSFNNNMPFATYDRPDLKGCASQQMAGWWYNYCSYALLNGVYYNGGSYTPTGSYYNGIYWKDWRGYGYSLKFVSMTLSHI
ncbi:angiopoietin-related protein 2-like isoform X2 [Haliotis rubra]|uniref:angiopoietin-related protein 2-like isoform X2 n=1 Tax=Haliotis rubra TaxID=36100 RepID=UPI001EE59161|nr:angiopoietin-related protein 2-like isoform X2 [Haliotis rubra]